MRSKRAKGQRKERVGTHIDSNMTNHPFMMRESYIFTLIMNTIGIDGIFGTRLIVDNKSTLNINLDSAGIGDRLCKPTGPCIGGLSGVRVRNSRVVDGGSHDDRLETVLGESRG